jgi:hypothetical protein
MMHGCVVEIPDWLPRGCAGVLGTTVGWRYPDYASLEELVNKCQGCHIDNFVRAARASGIYDIIAAPNFEGTILMPSDDTFVSLGRELGLTIDGLLANKTLVRSILQYHISPSLFDRVESFTSYEFETLLTGQSLEVVKTVDGSTATLVGLKGKKSMAKFLEGPGYANGLIGTNATIAGNPPVSSRGMTEARICLCTALAPDCMHVANQHVKTGYTYMHLSGTIWQLDHIETALQPGRLLVSAQPGCIPPPLTHPPAYRPTWHSNHSCWTYAASLTSSTPLLVASSQYPCASCLLDPQAPPPPPCCMLPWLPGDADCTDSDAAPCMCTQTVRVAVWAVDSVILPDIKYPKPSTSTPATTSTTTAGSTTTTTPSTTTTSTTTKTTVPDEKVVTTTQTISASTPSSTSELTAATDTFPKATPLSSQLSKKNAAAGSAAGVVGTAVALLASLLLL